MSVVSVAEPAFMAKICINWVKKIKVANSKESNIEKVDIENSSGILFTEKSSDKINATKKDLKLEEKNDFSLFETPTSLQKMAFPEVAHVESISKK